MTQKTTRCNHKQQPQLRPELFVLRDRASPSRRLDAVVHIRHVTLVGRALVSRRRAVETKRCRFEDAAASPAGPVPATERPPPRPRLPLKREASAPHPRPPRIRLCPDARCHCPRIGGQDRPSCGVAVGFGSASRQIATTEGSLAGIAAEASRRAAAVGETSCRDGTGVGGARWRVLSRWSSRRMCSTGPCWSVAGRRRRHLSELVNDQKTRSWPYNASALPQLLQNWSSLYLLIGWFVVGVRLNNGNSHRECHDSFSGCVSLHVRDASQIRSCIHQTNDAARKIRLCLLRNNSR